MNGGDKMIDLSCLTDVHDEVVTEMNNVLSDLYIKQNEIYDQLIYESDDYIKLNYTCFQEGDVNFTIPKQLDMYKFDNSHITKAIDHFDKFFDSIPKNEKVTKLNDMLREHRLSEEFNSLVDEILMSKQHDDYFKSINQLILKSNSHFKRGIRELNKQFDATIVFLVGNINGGFGTLLRKKDLNTGKLTISKSKGFQLGGQKIEISFGSKTYMLGFNPKKCKGQFFVSFVLHEIFHNIAHTMDVRTSKFTDDAKKVLESVNKNDTFGSVSAKMGNLIDRTATNLNVNKNEIKNKSRAVNRLYVLSKIKDNPGAVKQFAKDINNNADPKTKEELDTYIDTVQQNAEGAIKKQRLSVFACLVGIIGIALGCATGIGAGVALGAVSLVMGFAYLVISFITIIGYKLKSLSIGKISIREEQYCDLFAAMYQLPPTFKSYKKYLKYMDDPKFIEKIVKSVKTEHTALRDPHPMTIARDQCSYKIAKQILSSKEKLKPQIREYLEYIVEENEALGKVDLKLNKKEAKQLDPEAAKDLNRLINLFAKKTGVTITESFIENFTGGIYYA